MTKLKRFTFYMSPETFSLIENLVSQISTKLAVPINRNVIFRIAIDQLSKKPVTQIIKEMHE